MKRILRRFLRVIGWTVVSIFALILLIFILIQIPAVQNYAKGKVITWLEGKIKTKVRIDNLSVSFPKQVVLEGVYFEDQNKDTLLSGKRIQVDIALFKLLDNTVELKYLELDGIRTKIYRKGNDTAFNFQYIVNAFAAQQDANPDTAASAPMKFDLDKIVLKDIVANFTDDQTGSDMFLNLGNFETRIKTFNPDNFAFNVPEITLKNTTAFIKQYKPLMQPKPMAAIEAESNEPFNLALQLDKINTEKINFSYSNELSAINANLSLGNLNADVDSIDLNTLNIKLNTVTLANTNGDILLGKTEQAKTVANEIAKTTEAQVNNPWNFKINSLNISNNNIKFRNDNMPRQAKGVVDYGNLDVKDFTLVAENVNLNPALMSGNITQGAFSDKSGFVLQQLQTDFMYSDTVAYLKNLLLRTDKTELKDNILIRYDSVMAMADRVGDLYIDANLNKTSVAVKDVVAFAPMLSSQPPFNTNRNAVFKLNGNFKGYVKDLSFNNVELSGYGNTYLTANGKISGLPNADATNFNVNLVRLNTTKSDIENLLPKGTIPDNIRIPQSIAASGNVRGNTNDINTNIKVITSKGNADIRGSLAVKSEKYNANINLKNLDLGYILKQEQTMGRITAQVSAKGSGFAPDKANADFAGHISSFNYNKYNYSDVMLKGDINSGVANVSAVSNDPNVNLDITARANLTKDFPDVNIKGKIDSVDLYKLGFSAQPFKLHGNIDADIPVLNPDDLVGTIKVSDLLVLINGQRIKLDTLFVNADRTENGNSLAVNTEFFNANLNGKYKLTEIGNALMNTINQYYKLPGYTNQPVTAQQNFTLTASMLPSPVLFALVPQLEGTDTVNLEMNYNSSQNEIGLIARASTFQISQYDSATQNTAPVITIDSVTLAANNNGNALNYAVTTSGANAGFATLYNTKLQGNLANNNLHFALNTNDAADKIKYTISGNGLALDNGLKLSLEQDSLLLNYQPWVVSGDNFIQITDEGILVNNFNINNNNQSLIINSTQNTTNSPLNIQFKEFAIGSLTSIASQDSVVVNGIINGNALVRNLNTSPVFTSDITVNNLAFLKDTVGTLSLKVNNETANTLAADVGLTGNGNDVRLDGKYFISNKTVDMDLNLVNLNLATVKAFAAGQLRDASGNLKGNVDVKGTIANPQLNGSFMFDDAFIAPTLLGEKFSIDGQEINFDNRGIRLDNFTLTDSSGNEAYIDGRIITNDYLNYNLNLGLTADNFRLINSTKQPNAPFYGKLNVDTDIKVRGEATAPTANGYVRINKETDFTVVLPSSDPEVVSREGVVEFVDMDSNTDSIFTQGNFFDSLTNQTAFTGFDVSANIETDTSAQFTLIVDERTGDALKVRGKADLAGGIDKSGKMSLTGNYELNDGSYNLSFNLLKRNFTINRGSVITWTGDPTTAIVNITATYVANTNSLDLMAPQLAGAATTEVNRYKERLPFNVILKMTGELLKPTFAFDIQLPEEEQSQWQDVVSKLEQIRRDDAELNKQVFALLLLNRFVQENPFESSSTFNAESLARQSVSRILTEQLNKFAQNLIQGVDITFGVNSEEDYSTGELQNRTDLTVGVSKKLLDDRLRVSVGSNFEIEGPRTNNSNSIIGDLAIDYQLTKDGRYMVRAYRKNQYETVVEGQVVETGVSFIFTMEFDKFREIFQRRKKQQQTKNKKLKPDAMVPQPEPAGIQKSDTEQKPKTEE